MGDEKKPTQRYVHTATNPQAPMSPLLADYIAKNNLTMKMSVEDAKEWFDNVREALRVHGDKRK